MPFRGHEFLCFSPGTSEKETHCPLGRKRRAGSLSCSRILTFYGPYIQTSPLFSSALQAPQLLLSRDLIPVRQQHLQDPVRSVIGGCQGICHSILPRGPPLSSLFRCRPGAPSQTELPHLSPVLRKTADAGTTFKCDVVGMFQPRKICLLRPHIIDRDVIKQISLFFQPLREDL